MRKIGTDVSIKDCRAEGYMMVDLVKFTPTKQLHFTATWPAHCEIKGFRVDAYLSFEDLVNIYLQHKEGVDSFADYENCSPDFVNPTIYDALHLASDLDAYCGL